MRKKDKLYIVNRHNQNLFAFGGDTWEELANADKLANPWKYAQDGGSIVSQYQNQKNWLGISKKDNPFSKGNIKGTMGNIVGSLGSTIGSGLNSAFTGGFNYGTEAGNAIGTMGGQVGSALSSISPLLGGAVSIGSGLVGGIFNRMFGHQENEKTKATVKSINQTMENTGNAMANASSNDDFLNMASSIGERYNISDKGFVNGWFNNAATEAYNNMVAAHNNAANRFGQRLAISASSVDKSNDENTMKDFFAYGGPIEEIDYGKAIDYSFMNDYLTMKNDENRNKNKISETVFTSYNAPAMFALGGDVQKNGSDYTTGMYHINAGGTHSENPYDGVQVGISKENGQPNLVEEGETIFDDFVYSNRIMIDNETKRKFHIGKKTDMSYADLSKKIEEESSERPNDPISRKGFSKQMHDLADEQERQKSEVRAKEAKDAFAQLSPEQQAEIMQQIAMQQNGEASMQSEGIPGQQIEQTTEESPVNSVELNSNINTLGGNLYPEGGSLKEKIYKILGYSLDSDFNKWAADNKIGDIDWDNTTLEDIKNNKELMEALGKSNSAIIHAIDKGYDFGTYKPDILDRITIQSIDKGNWDTTDGKGWIGSEDSAFQQATAGLSNEKIEALTTEQLAERMKNTDAYKKTSEWLKNKDNALLYLNTLLNNENTPKVAKDYASKFIKDGKWKEGFNYDYSTVFGSNGKGVRETNPGTYWHSVSEANRGSKSTNYFIDENGEIEPIIGEVPKDWVSEGSYSWADKDTDNIINYYKRPITAASENTSEETTYTPIHKPTWGRTLGLMGPAAGLGMMIAGVGKPDYSGIDAAVTQSSTTPMLASYRPISSYLRYSPMDIWAEQNRMNATSRATDRAIRNTNGTAGTKMAGLLASGYNDQLASADLNKKAHEYNNTLMQQVAAYNRATDMTNADAFRQTSATNAGIMNAANQQTASMMMNAAQQKMAADASWYNSLYGNVNQLFKGFGQWGKENEQFNILSDMAGDGVFGSMGNSYTSRRYGKNNKNTKE